MTKKTAEQTSPEVTPQAAPVVADQVSELEAIAAAAREEGKNAVVMGNAVRVDN